MADFVFNQAKGRVTEFAERINANDPANSVFTIVLLDASATDAINEDFDDLALVIADAGNVEATFTNYARKEIDNTGSITITYDDTNNRADVDMPDQTFTSAGNGTNNSITDLLFNYDNDSAAGTDSDIVPCTQHDFVVQTDGSDITAQITNFFRAS